MTPIGVLARMVGVFSAIGLGLGVGALLFLWGTGYFETRAEGLEGLGAALAGGIALAGVSVFAILIGVVLAALGGMYAATNTTMRGTAVVASAMAGGLGHIALIVVLGLVLAGGVALLSPKSQTTGSARPSDVKAAPTPDPECVEIFGADSQVCQPVPETTFEEPKIETSSGIDLGDYWWLALGFLPAAIVGALSAALLFSRRLDEPRVFSSEPPLEGTIP